MHGGVLVSEALAEGVQVQFHEPPAPAAMNSDAIAVVNACLDMVDDDHAPAYSAGKAENLSDRPTCAPPLQMISCGSNGGLSYVAGTAYQ